MKRKLSTVMMIMGLCAMSSSVIAQEAITIPDTLKGWQHSWVAGFNGSQASYSNWSQGGVNTVTGTASSLVNGRYRKDRYGYGYVINLKYGRARIEDQGVRKTDDRIAFRNRWSYNLSDENKRFQVFATAGLQTQFDEGFDFEAGPNGEDVKISDFFAPGYFTQNMGMAYQPVPYLSIELGLGLKQTVVSIDSLAPLYGVSAGENFRSEGGFSTGISFEKQLMENIVFSSQFSSFTNFLVPVSSTDIGWANQLIGKINRYINTTLQFEIQYDDDFSNEIQTKQVLSVGIAVSLY